MRQLRRYVDEYEALMEVLQSDDQDESRYSYIHDEADNRAYDAEVTAALNLIYSDVLYRVSSLCVKYHEHPMTAKIVPLGNFLWGREVCRTVIEASNDKPVVRLVSSNVDLPMEYYPEAYADCEIPWEEELVDIAKKFNKKDPLGSMAYLEIERVHNGDIVTLTPHKPKNLIR